MRLVLSCLGLVLCLGCSTRTPSAQHTLLGITGYGVSLELLSTSASSPAVPGETEVSVGKYASGLKRGSVWATGTQPAPLVTDFSITNITATTCDVNRLAAVPAPGDRWEWMIVDALTGAIAIQNFAVGTPGAGTGMTTGRSYRAQIRWRTLGAATSGWSPPITFSTL